MEIIPIFYQDRWLTVCEKPAGLLSQGEGPDCLPTLLSRQLGGPILSVHRLDRGTAGLMVFARSPAAAAALSRAIGNHQLKKGYLALVSGAPDDQGTMTDYLFKDSRSGKVYPVSRMRKGVREARLIYRTLWRKDSPAAALVWVQLETGRTHQIRAQFSSREMPLWGDGKYGSRVKGPLALFSSHLAFPHPETGEALSFFALPTGSPWEETAEPLTALAEQGTPLVL